MTKQCEYCDKEFIPRKRTSKYCSVQCQHLSMRKRPLTSICLYCGKEFSLGRDRKGVYCSNSCRGQYQHKETMIKKEQLKNINEYNKTIKELISTMNKIVSNIDDDINRVNECKYCGNYYINSKRKSYCSSECARKADNRKRYENKDERLKRNGKPDYSITLDKLYKRDKGMCCLCGNKTNYNDYIIDSKGNFIVGYSYPSIDHIIPIAKGGVHQWYNVQLACHRCNTFKKDNLE